MNEFKQKLEETLNRLYKENQLSIDAYAELIEFAYPNHTLQLQQTGVMRWFNVSEKLPNELETVWLTNGKGWTCLGCLVLTDDGYHWAESNGVIYQENDKIVSECESEDLDVVYWHKIKKTIA